MISKLIHKYYYHDEEMLPRALRIAEQWGMETQFLKAYNSHWSILDFFDEWDLLSKENLQYLYGVTDELPERQR